MSSLFAFRLAKPFEVASEDTEVGVYDPMAQTSTWEGGSPALALVCSDGGLRKCNAYGTYCTTWSIAFYKCDSR